MKQPISKLKEWFGPFKMPTAGNFGDWIDSYWHKDSKIPASNVEGWTDDSAISLEPGQTELPELSDKNKSLTVLGGVNGRMLTYKGQQFPIDPNHQTIMFWTGSLRTWKKQDDNALPKGLDGQSLLPLFNPGFPGGYPLNAQVRDGFGNNYVSLVNGNTAALTNKVNWRIVSTINPNLSETGIYSEDPGFNIIAGILDFSLPKWRTGFYRKGMYLHFDDPAHRSYTDSIKVKGGSTYDYRFVLGGNTAVIFLDKNNVFVTDIHSDKPGIEILQGTITLPANVDNMRLSHFGTALTENIYFSTTEKTTRVTSNVFIQSGVYNENISSLTEVLGVETLEKDINAFPFLKKENFNNEALFSKGYLHKDKTFRTATDWYYPNWLTAPKGLYATNIYLAGNASLWIKNKAGDITTIDTKGATNGSVEWTFELPDAESSFRPSLININGYMTEFYVKPINDSYIKRGGSDYKKIVKATATKRINQPLISFISDDGGIENDWFINLLDQKDWKCSFAVIAGRYGNDFESFFDKVIVRNLVSRGFNFMNHTLRHYTVPQNLPLTSRTDAELHEEIGKAKFITESIDARISLDWFVSPQGYRDYRVDSFVRQYHKGNFVIVPFSPSLTLKDYINYPPLYPFNIKRASADAETTGKSHLQICKDLVDYVAENGGMLVFAIHPNFVEYKTLNTIDRQAEIAALLNYIQQKDIPVVTADKAYEHYKNIDIGYKGLDDHYFTIGADGNEYGDLV